MEAAFGKSVHARDRDRLDVARAALSLKLREYRHLQRIFMPGIHISSSENLAAHPEKSTLLLPSELDNEARSQPNIREAATAEADLLDAAAQEALDELRCHIRTRSSLVTFKLSNVRGVKDSTRSLGAMRALQALIDGAARTYHERRRSLLLLRGPGDWEQTLRVLRPQDVRGMNTDEPSSEDLANELAARIRGLPVVDGNTRGDISAQILNAEVDLDDDLGGDLDDHLEEPTIGEVAITPLTGGVNRGQRGRDVSWIWLGTNLAQTDNADPSGEFTMP
jgi:hypothetical protein